jgi:hypothetical protein
MPYAEILAVLAAMAAGIALLWLWDPLKVFLKAIILGAFCSVFALVIIVLMEGSMPNVYIIMLIVIITIAVSVIVSFRRAN